ncbi:MAG TPA: hypothetical protein VMH35_25435 [Streptosporangiaceae bacterium]|nr:hypothetical protein [Streptosporangiaceae bacterium]
MSLDAVFEAVRLTDVAAARLAMWQAAAPLATRSRTPRCTCTPGRASR